MMKTFGKIIAVVFGLLMLLVMLAPKEKYGSSGASASDDRERDRYPITQCWESQARKSLSPSDARGVAALCEGLERSYITKYNAKP